MRGKLIAIGNSQDIRIPKTVIEQYGLGPEIEFDMQKDALVIRAVHSPRKGWDDAFAKMRRRGDDKLLDVEKSSQWDRKAWRW